MSLTKTPLDMLDAGSGAVANDKLIFNGSSVEAQSLSTSSDDLFVNDGNYDATTGILSLYLSDGFNVVNVINISGFMTPANIGVGQRGSTGPKGPSGQNGRNGIDGRPGERGCQGPKGDRGPQGITGPAGPTGPVASAGPQGPAGPTGPQGPAGANGATPVLVTGTVSSYETLSTGRILSWGRFTDAVPGNFKRILFPEAFSDTSPRAIILQWVNPTSNVANKVYINSFNAGYCELGVSTSLLATEPDGLGGTRPVAMSGWDLYWIALGR